VNLTQEQEQARTLFETEQSVAIQALAGTGKTSTLVELARSAPHRRGAYLSFNDAIASEARRKFPANVNCNTTHAEAVVHLKKKGFDHQRLVTCPNLHHLKEFAPLANYSVPLDPPPYAARTVSRDQFCSILMRTLYAFAKTPAPEITWEHVPSPKYLPLNEQARKAFMAQYRPTVESIWERMCDPSDSLPIGHDLYLKMWTLDKPDLGVDFVMLDEAQDTNDPVLDLLKHQSCQVVYVGDSHQQIYDWRGAVDALKKTKCTHNSSLTGSFRFGEQIAHIANGALRALGSVINLRGLRSGPSSVLQTGAACEAVLFRGNKPLLARLAALMQQGRKVAVTGGVTEWLAYCEGLDHLEANVVSSHPELFGFRSYAEYRSYVSFHPELAGVGGQLLLLREGFGADRLRRLLVSVETIKNPEVTLSTVYKAKGLEWNSVELNEDLAGREGFITPSHKRLQYVAVTRAIHTLQMPFEVSQSIGF
jgi:hypothetical protein